MFRTNNGLVCTVSAAFVLVQVTVWCLVDRRQIFSGGEVFDRAIFRVGSGHERCGA